MIRKYHNHKLQTTQWHHEEEPLNHHEIPGSNEAWNYIKNFSSNLSWQDEALSSLHCNLVSCCQGFCDALIM